MILIYSGHPASPDYPLDAMSPPRISSLVTALAIASRFASRHFTPPSLGPLEAELTISQPYVQLSNRRPVRVEFAPVHLPFPPHDHEFYEICIVTAGSAYHLTSEGKEKLTRGSVIVVTPGQVHGFWKTQNFGLVNVYYLAEWFLANMQALRDIDRLVPLFFQQALFPHREPGAIIHFQIPPDQLADCLRDLDDLNRESLHQECEPLFLESCFIKCLVRIARALAKPGEGASPSAFSLTHTLPPPIAHALRQLEGDAARGEMPVMQTMAREAGVSLPHFCRLFKRHIGMSAISYFQRRRIQRACHRLLTTEATVTEIAYAFGYSDGAHFSRLFKATTGLTPRDYRKKFSAP